MENSKYKSLSFELKTLRVGDESWIYAYNPETKQQSTVWVFQDELNPTKVIRDKSTLKPAFLIESTGHPPYSPDLAPNDLYLLPGVKNKLRGQRLSSLEKAVDAFKMHVL
ncbi:hypothetical protein EVAR_12821_1 [Eumeta japonica]|uniref:Mariner Mos1 transposase n=1 Tax=Eumeta variegata TaxID=151549 RepID=A0A4C1UB37_EUMVA|nr:hypothetical protein EVAR_12821_1 [Eumeta japonica]